jgi:HSP20 family protein
MHTCQYPKETALSFEKAPVIHHPQSSITEHESGTRVSIALPGVRKEDLKLTLLDAGLKIEATRDEGILENTKARENSKSVRHYRLELRLSSRLDGTKTLATLRDGVLTLQVPLREEAKPRQIQVI